MLASIGGRTLKDALIRWLKVRKEGVKPLGSSSWRSFERQGALWARRNFRSSLYVGGLAIVLYAFPGALRGSLQLVGLGLLLACAGLLVGGLIGFLFGVPRTLERSVSTGESDRQMVVSEEFRGNTNLEQISDWLTKILVGLSLVEFRSIEAFARQLITSLAPAFAIGRNAAPASKALVFGCLVLFTVLGFFLGYLLTRLYMPLALEISNREEHLLAVGLPTHPRLAQLAGPAGAAARIEVLSQRYDLIWATLPPSQARLELLDLVVDQMRTQDLTIDDEGDVCRHSLMFSGSPGRRLAAIASLQVRPTQAAFSWLADRVASELSFVGFQAALALLYAAQQLDAKEYREELLLALHRARRSCGPERVAHARRLDEALHHLLAVPAALY